MTALTCRVVEERFSAPRAPRSALRRAIWRWHAEREARFASRNPILPESQLETIRRVYETLPRAGPCSTSAAERPLAAA